MLIGVGVVYGVIDIMWLIRFSFSVKYVRVVFIIGISMNGRKNSGFMMIGVLKRIGLLMLNMFGMIFIWLIVCRCMVLLCSSISVSGRVELMLLISR